MEIMLTDMLENGGWEGKTSESAVKILLLDLCELPLPHVLNSASHATLLFLVLAIVDPRRGYHGIQIS